MSASAPKLPAATLADLLALPADEMKRYELIEGALVERGAASGSHGGVQFNLSKAMGPFARRPGGRWPGGWWFGTEVDVHFDAANTLRPDVCGWRRERVPEAPKDMPVMVRPDWVCEILSTNRRNDLIRKKRVYHRHAVPHYWIIDPVEESLSVLRWTPDGYFEILAAERGEVVRAEPFEVLPLRVGVLFGEEDEEEGPATP
ncbi:MAG: Uma2 family endonuclease [Polyangiaceae bacterium]|nr:Uma2 family endonuclease [Polyangiaceae bacterium]